MLKNIVTMSLNLALWLAYSLYLVFAVQNANAFQGERIICLQVSAETKNNRTLSVPKSVTPTRHLS